jgi:HD-GYP domain-containing protein (c-di-GMP phosphodiesterase class II)
MWFPFEHGLHSNLITMRLCDALGVDSETASQTYYVSLLLHVGCTTDGERQTQIFYGSATQSGMHGKLYANPWEMASSFASNLFSMVSDPEAGLPTRLRQAAVRVPRMVRVRVDHFTAYCEVSEMVADGVGLPPAISTIFALVTERWDGLGQLRRARGEAIPLPLRIAVVGADAAYHRLWGDDDYVVETIANRGGHAFDPAVTTAFVDNAADVLGPAKAPESAFEEVLAAEPRPWFTLENEAIDRALLTMGSFADLASPYLSGHASGVGELASDAARLVGWDDAEMARTRRAGYLHDIGRTGVDPRIWTNEGSLSADEWEQVRLHPYHTQRVLAPSPVLSSLADIACSHHERLDGSGYHRSVPASAQSPPARLLAAADAFWAKTERRAYRDALSFEDAAKSVVVKAEQGKLDSHAVAAVVEAAGQTPPTIERPAGLTEREVQVIGLLARGRQTKQIARELEISVKTADSHIQNAYRKMGVSTRASATLFAAEHGLVA